MRSWSSSATGDIASLLESVNDRMRVMFLP
jgi:hypothetical protein